MIRNLIRRYAKLNNGDFEKAVQLFCEQIEHESEELITEMINEPIILGVSLKSIVSKSIEDLAFFSALMFWAILGKDYKKMWTDPELIKDEDGTYRLVMTQKSCVICAEERELKQEDFKGANFGDILSSIFKGIAQALQDYIGNDFDVTARETKCFMRGDAYGEITLWLKPRSD
ncbi:MAG: hypothetical protein ACTSRG_14910 [Candidatus Helarchaeota archaeon]